MKNMLILFFIVFAFGANAQITNPAHPDYKPNAYDDCTFEMPNALSPNGDSTNDCVQPITSCVIGTLNWTIFNRWGQKVYATTDPKACWMGQNDKEVELPAGTYYWVVEYTWEGEGEKHTAQGHVTLVR